jgi:hypothetical protein
MYNYVLLLYLAYVVSCSPLANKLMLEEKELEELVNVKPRSVI